MSDQTTPRSNTDHDVDLLRRLGWSEHFEQRLAAMDHAGGRIARVASARRGLFLVTDGREEWLCPPAGRLLRGGGDYPVTGDWVLVHDAVVRAVVPRRNMLCRGEAGARSSRAGAAVRAQPIAANLDTVFIVCGLDRDFNVRRLERYLTLVYNCGLDPVVVLTKADLHESADAFLEQAEGVALGVPVVAASNRDGRGRAELEAHLGPGRTVAMVGSSGAGKSTLANLLHGSDIRATAEVSAAMGKGRHTTTTRELIRMPQGGLLMDNPGIREIAFHEQGAGMDAAFADLEELAGQCRFADCSHRGEPGCAVLRAVEDGRLERERLESYRKMQREMEYVEERRHKTADRVEKERWRDIALSLKRMKDKRK